jgi:hypothetical protein
VARFLVLRFQQRDQEVMGALFLDVRHWLLGGQEIFRGTLHRTAVEPREILKECLLRGAGGVVLFHTPSGDPTPSYEDRQFTRRMAQAAALVGVELLDHLVLGATRAVGVSQETGRMVRLGDDEGLAATLVDWSRHQVWAGRLLRAAPLTRAAPADLVSSLAVSRCRLDPGVRRWRLEVEEQRNGDPSSSVPIGSKARR